MFGPPFDIARGVCAPSMGEAWRVSYTERRNPGGAGRGWLISSEHGMRFS